MRFLIDAQLPPAWCKWFDDLSFTAEHVTTRPSGQTPDADVVRYAIAHGFTLVTKDGDFIRRFPPRDDQLIWLRCGNISNRALRSWMDARASGLLAALEAGERFVEVR